MVARCAAAAPVLSANFVLWNTLEKGQVNHFPLPFVQAASGEPEAVGTVLQYYRRRIQCAARVNGRVDQDTEDYITQTLLTAIFKFRFGR